MFELNLEEHVCFMLVNVLLINVIVECMVYDKHCAHERTGVCEDCSLMYKREGFARNWLQTSDAPLACMTTSK